MTSTPAFNISIYWLCALTFALAAAACAIVTPLVRRMAFAVGVFDQPDEERRIHSRPTPRLGGVALFIGFMLALFTMLNVALTNNYVIHHFLGTRDLAHIIGLLSGGTLMMGVGLWDDIMGMAPRRKFAAQFVVALAAIMLYKFIIEGFTLPHFGYVSLGWLAIPFSLFWYLGMVNAVNFLDGLDGLLSGVTLIASITMILVSLWHHQYLVAITMCALGGAAAGFLPFNYHPARIFMGDGGALFIGFVLASAAVMGTEKGAVAISLLVPLLVLALPIVDTANVIVRRLQRRAPVFGADRSHMHHQLLEYGLSQRQVVNLMYVVCCILGAIALALSRPGGPRVF
ncbi:MAG: undecaprenyl-phosphate alpha-N-acetylglucosaminyl 1-phosphate transferase [Candidatus Eremiobacter antarcticus]|nr:undecaprenyl/decaprenyl-phosphate alpha-N-acetylglucosaminyl 1-phosphate transferase [Candidatus Eremiobacteraeota bacterium]MBC5808244.1 undecaprenyl/decaprenyl-phosphate alpha-N-acetylglucosaminyl 1-phosphate transferase [Candidatus Eremiobacteraeota bacterium]PZR63628.1 MAG: undecaprenyl-phosphate alpha-N-acetylglucosaminyl 1-phosphate transferase [Candidatus Eremiobacter sp. RRmetagenome_bin22]